MKHPLRDYEHNVSKDNGITFEIVRNYYFFKILNLFCARFEWIGLPEEIQPAFIEQTMFWCGKGVFIYDDVVKKHAFMKLALSGMPDIYNIPVDRWAYASNGYIEEYGKNNSVILWDNYISYPFQMTALMYATSMANVWMTRDINIFSQRTPVCISCTDEQKLTYQIIGEEYLNYVPIIKLNDNIDLDRIKVLKLESPYIVDKCEQELRMLMSQLLTDLGYESNPIEKRERLVVDETLGNNGETEGMRNVSLSLRERCANSINELWGLHVTVKFRSALPSMLNGFIPTNFTTTDETKEGAPIE